jgi:hypothetical protein
MLPHTLSKPVSGAAQPDADVFISIVYFSCRCPCLFVVDLSRDSRRHFKLAGLAVGSATSLPLHGVEEGGEHSGILSQRNRRFSFQVQSGDGSVTGSSGAGNHFVSPAHGHHHKGRHGGFVEETTVRGGRRGGKVSKHGTGHVSGPKHVTEDSVASAMEFLNVGACAVGRHCRFCCSLFEATVDNVAINIHVLLSVPV